MGCFTVFKYKKKRSLHVINKKATDVKEGRTSRLPEPESHGPSLQSAPASFRNRSRTSQPANKMPYSRARALSAPSSLVFSDEDALTANEINDQEEVKGRGSVKEQQFSNPLPLPLPSPESTSVLKNMGSFKARAASGPIVTSGPLPLPPLGGGGLRNFSYEEVSSACQHFSGDRCVSEGITTTVYKATFGDEIHGSKKIEATVTRSHPSSQDLKDFMNVVNTLASLQHPNLCKLIGFHAQEGSNERMLVYERLYHGTLERLLHGKSSDGPSIDWSMRIKVALCAARGLAFLHEEGPFQAMYNEFSTSNIQVDKDFSAKLSGYGCVGYNNDAEISSTSTATANLSVETLEKGLLTPKSNVWSFGIVLLELLTGRKNLDSHYPKEERNIVKWSKPFLADDYRLSLIMDPRIKGRFPPKAGRIVADVALKCLQKDPSERPIMRTIVESLASVQDMKYPCRHPLQEPSTVSGKVMMKSSSLNGIILPQPAANFSPSPPSRIQPLVSPRTSTSLLLPPRTCSSTITLEETRISTTRRPSSPIMQRPRVEGF